MQQAGSTRPQARSIGFALAALVAELRGDRRYVGLGCHPGQGSRSRKDHARLSGRRKAVLVRGASGAPTGYSVELCQKLVDELEADLGIAELAVDWVPVTLDQRFADVAQGKVDLLCAADSVTLDTAEGSVVLGADIPQRNKRGPQGRCTRRRLPTC